MNTVGPDWTARNMSDRVNRGELSVDAAVEPFVAATERRRGELNTHLYWNLETIKTQVTALKARLASGAKLPLAGVPVVIKDNICVRGMPNTCGSKILAGFIPPYDAHVVERLKDAGALVFGKANCDEFAMGSTNENSAYGPVRNPVDPTRVPGGSSGGSAAAVAAGMAPLALGSDTGGSIRQPAAFCGVVGFKPTYGLVSRYGLVAYGSSLDQIGPISHTVEDAALTFDVLSGHDPRDSTSLPLAPAQTAAALASWRAAADLKKPGAGLRLGIIKELFGDGVDAATKQAVESAIEAYRRLGATVTEISLPYLKYAIAAYYVLATAEASANLARFDGVRYGYRHQEPGQSLKDMYCRSRSEGFGREVKQRIMLGTFALSSGYYDAYYAKANRARHLLGLDFERALQSVDLLVSPTVPTTAFLLGEKLTDPLAMYLSDIGTITANLVGVPALSLPCVNPGPLPVGLQLMGRRLGDFDVLKGAYIYEQFSSH